MGTISKDYWLLVIDYFRLAIEIKINAAIANRK
jgi:hypothetical protein